jgi:hypothetical protein
MDNALSEENNFSIWPAQFAKHSYRIDLPDKEVSTTIDPNPAHKLDIRNLQFCPGDVKTLASRGLFFCSPKMSAYDAFTIAEALQNKLNDIPHDSWGSSPPQTASEARKDDKIRLPVHPGAQWLKDNKSYYHQIDPRGWPTWLQIMVMTVITSWLGIARSRIQSTAEPLAPSIQERIALLGESIRKAHHPMSKATAADYDQKIVDLHEEIIQQRRKDKLDQDKFDQLRIQLREFDAILIADVTDPPPKSTSSPPSQQTEDRREKSKRHLKKAETGSVEQRVAAPTVDPSGQPAIDQSARVNGDA